MTAIKYNIVPWGLDVSFFRALHTPIPIHGGFPSDSR